MRKKCWRLAASALAGLLLTLALFALGAPRAKAAEAFTITNYQVQVVVGSDRACHVTETLDINFHEERHGIIRNIPYEGDAEKVSVVDVNVEGAPFSLEPYGGSLNIRIGDANRKVIGDVRYVISYTLVHADDGQPEADYLYLNLIGTQWDTTIAQATLDVTLPDAELTSYRFHAGYFGATGDADRIMATRSGRQLHVELLSPLAPYEGVTLMAVFAQGAFPDAPARVEPLIVGDVQIQAAVDRGRSVSVRERWDITLNEPGALLTRVLALGPKEKVVGIRPTGGGDLSREYKDGYLLLRPGAGSYATGQLVYGMEYTRRLGLEDGRDDADIVSLDLLSLREARPIHQGIVTLSFPQAPDSWTVFVDGKARTLPYAGIEGALGGNTLTLTIGKPLPAGTTIAVEALFPQGTFRWTPSVPKVLAVALSLIVLGSAILLFLKLGKDQPLAPPVEFYPPDELDPAALGYIIDQVVQNKDITALIFYWAAHGHLQITQDRSDFTLTKGSPLEGSHARYEHIAYNKLWQLGRGGQVTNGQLENHYYTTLAQAKGMVPGLFTGARAMKDKLSTQAAGGMLAVALIFLAVFQVFSAALDGTSVNFFGVGIAVALTLVIRGLFRRLQSGWSRRSVAGNTALIVTGGVLSVIMLAALTVLGTGMDVSPLLSLWMNAAGLGTLLLSAFLDRRSPYGQRILERVVGFRDFLRDAEKERLEALLQQNPDYYYDILPYAQVLGVTNLWSDKFKYLVTQPPQWYHDTTGTAFNTILFTQSINRSMNAMQNSMVSQPQSSSGGGGGGGGGFSGGGFSGGGSGGGGGSSW